MSLSDLLEITFGLSGLGLVLVAVFSAVANLFSGVRVSTWESQRSDYSFIGYAWQELGRALLLGFVAALGTTPIGVFVFRETSSFWSSLILLSGIWWVSAALLFFISFVFAGFGGYLRFKLQTGDELTNTLVWVQFLAVLSVCAPFFYVFVSYLAPTLWPVLSILGSTWQQYVLIYFS